MPRIDVPPMYPAACVDIHTELRQGVTNERLRELRLQHWARTGLPCDHGPTERVTYTVAQIREAFRNATPDDWGVKCHYETTLLAALALAGESDD